MKVTHLLFLLLINIAWGFNIVPTRWALEEVPPLTAAVLRFVLVALLCLPWLKPVPGQGKLLLGAGLASGVVMFGLNNIAYATADNVSALAIAGQIGVPLSLIIAILFLGERIALPRLIGIILSFAGVAWFSFDPRAFADLQPLLLLCGGSLAYAVGTLFLRQLRNVSALTVQAWVASISILPLFLLSLVLEPGAWTQLPETSLRGWASILFSAIAASIIGHAGLAWLLQRYSVSLISPLTLPAPLISVIFAAIILKTPVTEKMIQGGLVTLIGVAIITVRTAQRSPRPPKPQSPLP